MSSLFLTGGSGFVGSRLLPALLASGHSVAALDRTGALRRALAAPRLQVVTGDVLDPATYRGALAGSNTVVHLAATTGRASADQHQRVNAVATEALVAEARRAGVRRMLFVSSIAVAFPDLTAYPYAQAKRRAEDAVRQSGLDFVILRPTMILGAGSPLLAALERLALLPVMPVFGDGSTRVQPVSVDDVARAIAHVIDHGWRTGETMEIGGPETLPIEELLQRIRQTRRGTRARSVHVPISLVWRPLQVAEAIGLGRALPFTAGQLATFRFDGVATPNPLQQGLASELTSVPGMLAKDTSDEPTDLDRECRVFAVHLTGAPPDRYVCGKYAEAHRALPTLSQPNRFDEFLLRLARVRPLAASLADAYAGLLAPRSLLRQKLVVLLAILETSWPSSRLIDEPPSRSRGGLIARLAFRAARAVVVLAIGLILVGPAHLMLAGRSR